MNKTPISILQELMVGKSLGPPNYSMEPAPASSEYAYQCTVTADNLTAIGYASTKKVAKQNSAQNLLLKLGYTSTYGENNNVIGNHVAPSKIASSNVNYVGKLNEIASGKSKPYPEYTDNVIPFNGCITVSCQFMTMKTDGHGQTKKVAKQEAAKKMLDLLKSTQITTDDYQNIAEKKIENIDRLTDEVLRRLGKVNILSENEDDVPEIVELSTEKIEFDSLDDITTYLEKNGHVAKISVFQRNPYIVAMEIEDTNCLTIENSNYKIVGKNNNCKVMGVGRTERAAMDDLKKMAEVMIHHKFSFGIKRKHETA